MAEYLPAESINDGFISQARGLAELSQECLMSTAQSSLPVEKMVFRKTHQHKGRHISVTPGNSTNRHLSYGRIDS